MNAIAIGVIIVIFSIATYQRNLIWKDELSLWSDVVKKSPFKTRGRSNLAEVYLRLGHNSEAMQEYKSILTLDSKNARAHIRTRELPINGYSNMMKLSRNIKPP